MPAFNDLYGTRLDYELGNNDSVVLFTSARRKATINEGLREFADLTECWQKQSTITCSNGIAGYSLTSTRNIPAHDFVRLTAEGPTYAYTDTAGRVTYVNGESLVRRTEGWLNAHDNGWQTSTGATAPTAYYLDESAGDVKLTLVPPPTISSLYTSELVVPYVARPSSLTSDTAVPFTDTAGVCRSDLLPYHQAAVHYAAHKLEKLRKETEASDTQLKKFLGYVTRFLQAKRPKGGSTLRPARNYFQEAGRHRDDDGPRAKWW